MFVSPLLVMADATLMGLTGSTAQLAALAPGIMLLEFPLLFFTFLDYGTTSIMLRVAKTAGSAGVYVRSLRKALKPPFYLALVCGVLAFTAVNASASHVLGAMDLSAEVLPHVMTYVEVKSYFLPLRFLLVVLQALLLARGESLLLLKLSLAAAAVHLASGGVMCGIMSMGIQGIAAASIVSQAAMLLMLVIAAHSQGILPHLAPPPWSYLTRLVRLDNPLSTLPILHALGMTIVIVAAAQLGPVSMAANHTVMGAFMLLLTCTEPLHQTARTMLLRYVSSDDSNTNVFYPPRTLLLLKNLMVASVAMGGLLALVGCAGTWAAAGLVTRDRAVASMVQSTATMLLPVYLLSPLATVVDGALNAPADFHFLVGTRALILAGMAAGLWGLQSNGYAGLQWIWLVYAAHLVLRVTASLLRIESTMQVFGAERV